MKTHFSNQDFQQKIPIEEQSEGSTSPKNLYQIWEAAELFISPDLSERKKGFERLVELGAVKQHPVIVFILASRLSVPDLSVRSFIVRVLAGLLEESKATQDQLEDSKYILINYLSQISSKDVFSLLELAEVDPPSKDYVVQLLCSCASAGDLLKSIVINRDNPIELRLLSLDIIGKVGYLEALNDLERMERRIRNKGMKENSHSFEAELLRNLEATIQLLRSP